MTFPWVPNKENTLGLIQLVISAFQNRIAVSFVATSEQTFLLWQAVAFHDSQLRWTTFIVHLAAHSPMGGLTDWIFWGGGFVILFWHSLKCQFLYSSKAFPLDGRSSWFYLTYVPFHFILHVVVVFHLKHFNNKKASRLSLTWLAWWIKGPTEQNSPRAHVFFFFFIFLGGKPRGRK